jgi:hypothetical protein
MRVFYVSLLRSAALVRFPGLVTLAAPWAETTLCTVALDNASKALVIRAGAPPASDAAAAADAERLVAEAPSLLPVGIADTGPVGAPYATAGAELRLPLASIRAVDVVALHPAHEEKQPERQQQRWLAVRSSEKPAGAFGPATGGGGDGGSGGGGGATAVSIALYVRAEDTWRVLAPGSDTATYSSMGKPEDVRTTFDVAQQLLVDAADPGVCVCVCVCLCVFVCVCVCVCVCMHAACAPLEHRRLTRRAAPQSQCVGRWRRRQRPSARTSRQL